jgi:hypothetical protein
MGTTFRDAFGWATGAASDLDWGAALAVLALGLAAAAIATTIGLSVAVFLRHGPLPTGVPTGPVEAGIRRWHRARGTADRGQWICERCRSWNVPSADACYRGCGPRGAVEMHAAGDAHGPHVAETPSASKPHTAEPGWPVEPTPTAGPGRE